MFLCCEITYQGIFYAHILKERKKEGRKRGGGRGRERGQERRKGRGEGKGGERRGEGKKEKKKKACERLNKNFHLLLEHEFMPLGWTRCFWGAKFMRFRKRCTGNRCILKVWLGIPLGSVKQGLFMFENLFKVSIHSWSSLQCHSFYPKSTNAFPKRFHNRTNMRSLIIGIVLSWQTAPLILTLDYSEL